MKNVAPRMPQQSIHDILEFFRTEARNNRELGDRFERLIVNYLKIDPLYAELYSNVWLWSEWPQRGKKPDIGIDIVAEERASGDLTAVQCKFFDPDHQLQKADIDSFFTASGKHPFKKRLIISTTDKWSKLAEDACKNQQIPVSRLRLQDLDESPVDWTEFNLSRPANIKLKSKKKLKPHQEIAVSKVCDGFKKADRGKLIMACGTGKTFTSLKIAESLVSSGGSVLFLVPSISLISQTLTEWCGEAEKQLSPFAVCSDPKAGKNKDEEDISAHDLAFPAHTNARLLAQQVEHIKELRKKNVVVIFSTYQSIKVVADAQNHGLPAFDLVVCDEAHRTTGIESLECGQKEASSFVLIHKPNFIKAKKRLYMTATPRIYDDASKGKAKEANYEIYSMDDPNKYGEELYRLDFSEAVRRGLLSDYKVMVLAVDEKYINKSFQSQLVNEDNELVMQDVVKIVGCYNGLRKRFISVDGDGSETIDPSPMRRAVAFNRSIKDSKKLGIYFDGIIKKYNIDEEEAIGKEDFLQCEIDHVDGTFNALLRNEKLQWLKANTTQEGNVCRILSNARCLSEGIDVPALDAVIFLNPRNSVVDVVQAVGRVMRKVEGKQYGYIILPIGVPADIPPEQALSDNEKYKVVWQVLQALRAHDNRFNAIINKLDLNNERPGQIQIIGVGDPNADYESGQSTAVQKTFNFPNLEDWENAIFAKIVVKCGSRKYLEDWAKDVAQIAQNHITRITTLLESADSVYRKKFDQFLKSLRKNLNPSISEKDSIEMLAQHLITKPVFDALFEGYEFTKNNPVSKAMQKMLDVLEEQSLEKETVVLEQFYASVRERVQGIDNAEGKQRIIKELYDNFFRAAFKKMADRLGIVYTPIEIVDFIVQSVEHVLTKEFGRNLSDENVHILDPFTGTGTFITRLLQSGLIKKKDFARKYQNEIHANELVLLAYYIAAVNIENAYHDQLGDKAGYESFEGIVLTDTFQLGETDESEKLFSEMFPQNSERVSRQKKAPVKVIIGNPPYSIGQKSANDNAQNQKYEKLDSRIANTYAKASSAGLSKSLYDAYIKAFRWGTDRLDPQNGGVIAFVSNGAWLDGNSTDGFRKILEKEFSSIWVFNTRGNARTQGDLRRREAGNVFGGGSRTPISITLLVKNPKVKNEKAAIYYYDIGDYLSREQKLEVISKFKSIEAKELKWQRLKPNASGDWINLRNEIFGTLTPMAPARKFEHSSEAFFNTYAVGVASNRDSWVYNYSHMAIEKNMRRTIAVYNEQKERFSRIRASNANSKVENFVEPDPRKISWTRALRKDLEKNIVHKYHSENARRSLYRPFSRQHLYFDEAFIESPGLNGVLFPRDTCSNLVICVSPCENRGISVLISDILVDLHFNGDTQCFPLYFYEEKSKDGPGLFDAVGIDGYMRRDGVSEFILEKSKKIYGKNVNKEDIFYYVYGLLHSEDYQKVFFNDLKKMLPRLPLVESTTDFWKFSKAGRKLAELHLYYEKVKPYPVKEFIDELGFDENALYQVDKMRFGKNSKEVDKTIIHYNSHIVLRGIPLEAYEYVVNGKSAIEWIMERYQISVNKDSGIKNDPNDWAKENNDPKYIFNLLKSIITVSLETMKIVKSLPPLEEIITKK